MEKYLLFFLLAFIVSGLFGQQDSTETINLLDELNSEENTMDATEPLLPNHIIITQRILWGEHGLMRNFNAFELTPEKRQREMKIRRTMLVIHQSLGFATLAGMVAQGIVGAKLYAGDKSVKDLHEAIAAGVNFGYFTTAGLALLAPPKLIDERKGYSSIKVHKALAAIHLSAMITTNVLADIAENDPQIKSLHRAAAFTAFGTYGLAMLIIKF